MMEISVEQYNKMAERLTELEYELDKSVKVVRCKDCGWYEDPRRKIFENCVRGGRIIPMKPTDYCSYGAPKDGDTN